MKENRKKTAITYMYCKKWPIFSVSVWLPKQIALINNNRIGINKSCDNFSDFYFKRSHLISLTHDTQNLYP